MKILFAAVVLACIQVAAKSPSKSHVHREHSAHEHGQGSLAIAFEGVTGTIELKAPAEAIVGFEHVAMTAADKKKEQAAYNFVEANMGKIVQFENALGCELMREKIETSHAGEHADTLAIFKVVCAKTPFGSTLTLENKVLPKLKDIDVTILVGVLQKSAELGQKTVTVELQ